MVELTALSSRKGRAIAIFLNFYVSYSNATRFLRNGKKCHIYFIDNLFAVSNSERIFKIG